MCEHAVSFAVERLRDLLIAEAKFLYGVSGQVDDIKQQLQRMRCFLKDADAKQAEDERVRNWVAEIRDLAYKIEDVVEIFAYKIEDVVKSWRGWGVECVLKIFANLLTVAIALHQVGKEIQKIKLMIDDLTRSLQTYGIKDLTKEGESSKKGESSSSTNEDHQQRTRLSNPENVPPDFVGREKDIEKLVSYLVKEERCRTVSIEGMGGLGKTTLAQKVFKHNDVRRSFVSFSWICVTQKFQPRKILEDILCDLDPELAKERSEMSDVKLMAELCIVQRSKGCLVVLDDIWSEESWDCLEGAFPKEITGSKILLTSRHNFVSKHVDPDVRDHQLEGLDNERSWELLLKIVFPGRGADFKVDATREELGQKMLERCKGLPLAISVLGGLLKRNDWGVVHQKIISYLQWGNVIREKQGKIPMVLGLSYHDLSYKLKRCFFYLGIFPEDSKINADFLCQLWIAEGLVLSEDVGPGETKMDVANRYLDELSQRNLIQVKVKGFSTVGRFKSRFESCRLHDLMRDLCLAKAKEESYFYLIDYLHGHGNEEMDPYSSTRYMYRLVFLADGENFPLPSKATVHPIRSLVMFMGEGVPVSGSISQINNFKMLRVLAVEGLKTDRSKFDHGEFAKAVGSLIHLRYLSLRGSDFYSPRFIGSLEHLQTLDLRGTTFIRPDLENVNWKMGHLKNLYLSFYQNFETKLKLDGVSNLETLEGFNNSNYNVKDLFQLTKLRSLGAYVERNFKDVAEITKRMNADSNQLQDTELCILYCDFRSAEELSILRQLLGCQSLHTLILQGHIGSLPNSNDQHFSSTLTKLRLQGAELQDDPMETLEKFPNLGYLVLGPSTYLGKEMKCSANGFPRLKGLVLWRLKELENWRVEREAMSDLCCLVIDNCKKLKTIPDGLESITTLQELGLRRMPGEFTNRVRVVDGQQGEDFYKVQHVPSIIINSTDRFVYL